ncbi:hypothetical protein SCHPADRAFT_602652 [Schizopora paradoxa]|uniref:Uncharacterized protein n=1 Tax=Schizopora paradoxa TaxID=27342 RepID=A0A0H2RUY4_9AGAM|nr:hypothetical protein SCHPADRAFT_602652 [Schizopora paradoxa]
MLANVSKEEWLPTTKAEKTRRRCRRQTWPTLTSCLFVLASNHHHRLLKMPTTESHASSSSSRIHESIHADSPSLRSEESVSSTRSRRSGGFSYSKPGIQSLWMKAIPKTFHSPRQIANEIRRLRGHRKSSVHERHRDFHAIGMESSITSCPNYNALFPHCMNLVAFGTRQVISI